VQLAGNPGMFLAGILVHQLFADPEFRTRTFFANAIQPIQLVALVLLLAGTYRYSAGNVAIGGSVLLALYYLLFVLGASRIAAAAILRVIVVAGLACVGLNVGLLLAPNELPIAFFPGFSQLRQVATAIVFVLLGGVFFHRQLPSELRPDLPGADAARSDRNNMLIGLLFWLAVASHFEVTYPLFGKPVTDGPITASVLQPLIFMLGVSFGARGLLLAALGLMLGEFLPALFIGGSRWTPIVYGDLQLSLIFPRPLDVVLSRLDDLVFALFGWGVMRAFRPAQRTVRENAANGSAPLQQAA